MYCIISTTTDSKEIVDRISKKIINLRYSPCIQIIDNVESNYRWNNEIKKSVEYKIIIKSIDKYVENIIDTIKLFHNYDIPEIISHNIDFEDEAYKDWFLENINK